MPIWTTQKARNKTSENSLLGPIAPINLAHQLGRSRGPNDSLAATSGAAQSATVDARLTLRGFQLEWETGIPDYFSNAIEFEDFKKLEIEGFACRQALASSADPVVALSRGQGVSIRGRRAEEGSATFVSLSQVERQGLFAQNDLRNSQRPFAPQKTGFLMVGNLLH